MLSVYRAEDWDLANPMLTGCLKIFQKNMKLIITIYRYKDTNPTTASLLPDTSDDRLEVFCECPIDLKPQENIIPFVDAVIDSSRYYVMRVKDPNSNRSMLLGVGFRERDQSFDFKNCLNDYTRFVDRMVS